MVNFTKGKWRMKGRDGKFLGGKSDIEAESHKRGCLSSLPIMCGKKTICLVVDWKPHYSDDDAELEANAALITSAPEMFELLKWASEKLRELGKTNDYTLGMCKTITECENLIKKIDGEKNEPVSSN